MRVNFKTHHWGIGVNTDKNGEVTSYGSPTSDDPEMFFPDPECSSQIERDYYDLCVKYKKQPESTKNFGNYTFKTSRK